MIEGDADAAGAATAAPDGPLMAVSAPGSAAPPPAVQPDEAPQHPALAGGRRPPADGLETLAPGQFVMPTLEVRGRGMVKCMPAGVCVA